MDEAAHAQLKLNMSSLEDREQGDFIVIKQIQVFKLQDIKQSIFHSTKSLLQTKFIKS